MSINKIVMLGAGNVATHLSRALHNEGYDICQVYSRSMRSAVELASELECSFTTELTDINTTADAYFVCVSDSAIRSVILSLPIKDKLIIHTAGSVDISIFADSEIKQCGVLYPLQTFSKFRELNYHEIPFFIEGNTTENENKIFEIARSISPKVFRCESDKRLKLHLSAVFACNFSNHMMAIAEDLLKENQLSFEVLKPMIRETFEKGMKYPPSQSQTGPAVRNDKIVVNKHLELLTSSETYKSIYETISKSIWDLKQKSNG